MAGGTAPELAETLANYLPSVFAWRFDDRAVCIGLGQWDRELPVCLVAGAGAL
ncbi:hypothetical protein GCM10009682_61250 [Luedemannella flava]|uniref:Uncharacterized protein n=2 Tax=Luedemannella flava TaxID=349316 RepID=A0ABN2MQ29_9ACTN